MSGSFKYIKPLSKKPILPSKRPVSSIARNIVNEFLESNEKYAEIPLVEAYANAASLARNLGRILHNKNHGLDPDNEIEVRSAKEKVYLLRK